VPAGGTFRFDRRPAGAGVWRAPFSGAMVARKRGPSTGCYPEEGANCGFMPSGSLLG